MGASMEVDEQSTSQATKAIGEKNGLNLVKDTADADEDLANAQEHFKQETNLETETSADTSHDQAQEMEEANADNNQNNKHNMNKPISRSVSINDMLVVKVIKALNETNGSSKESIIKHIEAELKKKGRDHVDSRKVSKILHKGRKQGLIHVEGDKYQLTKKGQDLGKNNGTQSVHSREDEGKNSRDAVGKGSPKEKEKAHNKVKKEAKKEHVDKTKSPVTETRNGQPQTGNNDPEKQNPNNREMIVLALKSDDSAKGMQADQIVKLISQKYKLDKANIEKGVKKTLKRGILKQFFVNNNGFIRINVKEDRDRQSVTKSETKPNEVTKMNKKLERLVAEIDGRNKGEDAKSKMKDNDSMGEIVMSAFVDLEKLTRGGSSMNEIQKEMIPKYKLDKSKFKRFLKDGIKQRGMLATKMSRRSA